MALRVDRDGLGLDAIIHTGRDSAIVHLKNAVRLDTSFAEAKILLLEQIDDSTATAHRI